jgi:hypothetical protein
MVKSKDGIDAMSVRVCKAMAIDDVKVVLPGRGKIGDCDEARC